MTQDELKTLVEYRDGKLYWVKPTSNRVKVGDEVGSLQPNGYVGARINGVFWGLHRLVYLYHNDIALTNTDHIDHIDRNRANNDISNLRLVTQQQNNFNCSNTKGYVRVGDKFVARITLNGKQYQIGTYRTAQEANEAYKQVKPIIHTFLSKHPSEEEVKSEILKIRPAINLKNTSGFPGVSKKSNNKWQSRVTIDGKRISLGYFDTPEEAYQAIKNYK